MALPLIGIIGRGIAWAVGSGVVESVIGRALGALGVGVATVAGVGLAFDAMKGKMLEYISGLPAEVIALASMAKLGVCLSIILSGYTMRLTLAGMTKAGEFIRLRAGKKS